MNPPKYEIKYIRRSDETEQVKITQMRKSDPIAVANAVVGLDALRVLSITKIERRNIALWKY